MLSPHLVLPIVFGLACDAALHAGEERTARDTERPNILFVFTDDHAAHAISAYGSKLCQTPNMDRLANEGMLLRNCFCGNSICAPSRATILTGKHSHENGVIDNLAVFDGAQQTFPKLLRGAGYQTAMIGKWHLKSDPTGFDHWDVLIGQGPYYNPPMKRAEGTFEHTGYTTDIITDKALHWLREEREQDRPFLLMYQHKAPHREWAPGPDHLTLYDEVTIPEPATLFDDWQGRTSAAARQEMTLAHHFSERDRKLVPPGNLTEEQLGLWNAAYGPKNEAWEKAGLEGEEEVRWRYQRYLKDYLRCIASVDDNLGRVLAYLDETGLAASTVVVYSSDQGFYLGDHGWYDKRWMYEESLRMPFLVRWPGRIQPGSESDALAQNIDFAPTFLEMAGVEVPEDMHGDSLMPVLRGVTPDDWRESIYYHYYEFPGTHSVARHCGVRTQTHKLIHYYQIDEWELFDLEQDPDELRSVYDEAAYAEVREQMQAELVRQQQHFGEPDPTAVDRIRERALLRQAQRIPRTLVARLGDGSGALPQPNCHARAVTVGGFVKGGRNGVIVAQGGGSTGFTLYLRDGVPHFAVRTRGEVFAVVAGAAIEGERVHVAGSLDVDGSLSVFVNGRKQGQARGFLLASSPSEGVGVGQDEGSSVGDYEAPFTLDGTVEDARYFWGALKPAEIRRWVAGEDPLQ